MRETVKPLKHYRRRRFLYKILMMKSPRAGAMFGLALLLLTSTLLPFAAGYGWQLLGGAGVNGVIRSMLFCLLIALPVTICMIYGLCCLGYALNAMLRKIIVNKNAREALVTVSSLCFPFAGAAVLIVTARAKRGRFALAGGASFLLAAAFHSGLFGGWLVEWTGIALLFAAFAGVWDRGRFRFLFVWPLAGAVALSVWIAHYHDVLHRDVKQERAELSRLVGRSVTLADYRSRDVVGFPVGDEPLATLIARLPKPGEVILTEYRAQNSEFVAALTEFLKLPPENVAHIGTGSLILTSKQRPELKVFSEGARYLALLLDADPENRENVAYCNTGMMRLRDWALAGSMGFEKAVDIEKIRLNSLNRSLAAGTVGPGWPGAPPDWRTAAIFTIGDVATMMEGAFRTRAPGGAARASGIENWIAFVIARPMRLSPRLYLHIHQQEDYRSALRAGGRRLELLRNPGGRSAAAIAEQIGSGAKAIEGKGYIFSRMMFIALERLRLKLSEVEDARLLAEIAGQVMEYRRTHGGKLPASLGFLPEKPLSATNRLPIHYQYGRFPQEGKADCYGFRLCPCGDEESATDKAHAGQSYLVRLPEPGKGEMR